MGTGWRERAFDRLASAPPWQVWGGALVLFVAVTALDVFGEAEVAEAFLFLLPISVAAWGRGRLAAGVVAIACASAWFALEVAHHPDTLGMVDLVNVGVLLAVYVVHGQLLAALRHRLEHVRTLAHTDALTGLHNRRSFWNALHREVARCRRFGEPFSLAYLDVDGFKTVNDRYGHPAGDELLRNIAKTLVGEKRELDLVARLGGDEFVLLMPGTPLFGASKAVRRLVRRLDMAPWRHVYPIDFSIGCLTVLDAKGDADGIVARADKLMYEVKRSGRGLVRHDLMQGKPADDAEAGPSTRLAR
jgi:diguanylate cyclase (GGDEF)-like protein